VEVGRRAFEELVADALDRLPDELAQLMENVAVFAEDRHDVEPDLLGLYDGIPLTERADYGGLVMPDRVILYRLPLCEMCDTDDELTGEVLVTVVHEIAHHFGIDDRRLHELGWD
jgi:predicted Zn-dependent protease with MMP-like domain